MGRDPDSTAYFVKSFMKSNVEGNFKLLNGVMDNDLPAGHPSRSYATMIDFARSFILDALNKKALEWHKTTMRAPYEPS